MILHNLDKLVKNLKSKGDPINFLKYLVKAIDDSNSPSVSIKFNPNVDPDGKTKLIEHL